MLVCTPPGLQAARTHEVLEQSAKRAAQVAKHVLHGNMPEWFLGQGAEIGRAAKKEGYRRVLRRQKANRPQYRRPVAQVPPKVLADAPNLQVLLRADCFNATHSLEYIRYG